MKDEIKEILEMIQELINEGHDKSGDFKKLLDYITNLQKYQESYRKELDYWRIQFSNKKEIIDKAIEYINHAQNYGTMAQVMPHLKPYVNGDDLLNILGGDE